MANTEDSDRERLRKLGPSQQFAPASWVDGCGRRWPDADDEQGQIEYGAVAVLREREERPEFQPTTSFLQRRLRWGYARASLLLPLVKQRADEMCCQLRRGEKTRADQLQVSLTTAEAFKAFVHGYLTEHGVPEGDPNNQHQIEGCRIGARLDLLLARLATAEAERDQWKERAENPRIYTKCPSCGNRTLTLHDKHLLCTWIECKDPTLIDRGQQSHSPRWIPLTERKPTAEDADKFGRVAFCDLRHSWCGPWDHRFIGQTHFLPLPKLPPVTAPDQQKQKDVFHNLREANLAALAYARKAQT